jgi:hypothetical protein
MNDTNDTEIKLSLNKESLDGIESMYNEMQTVFKNNFHFSKYETHFHTLHDALQQVVKNETTLYHKLSELVSFKKEMSSKYAQAIKLADLDSKTKSDLLEELERAWHQANVAKTRERKSLETVNLLKLEVYNLSKLVEQGVGLTMGQEYNVRELMKEKESLILENQNLTEDLDDLRRQLTLNRQHESELIRQAKECRLKEAHLNQELLTARLEIQKLTRQNERLNEEILNQKKLHEQKDFNSTRLNQTIHSLKVDFSRQESLSKDLQFQLEKCRKECDFLTNKSQKVQFELDQQVLKNDTLLIEISQLNLQLKRKSEQIDVQKFENVQIQKMRDLFEEKIRNTESDKIMEQNEKEKLKTQLDTANRQIAEMSQKQETEKKKHELVLMEKEKAHSDLKESQRQLEQSRMQLKITQAEMKSLKKECLGVKVSCVKLTRVIANFDKEKNSFRSAINDLTAEKNDLNGTIKVNETIIDNLNKNLNELKTKLNNVKHRYETARANFNSNSKILGKTQLELSKFKEKIEHLKIQETALTKRIQSSESNATRFAGECLKKDELRKQLEVRLDRAESLLNENKDKISLLQKSENQLLNLVKDLEMRVKSIGNDATRLLFERNILGSQLVRRNDEMSLLYEKIRLMEKFLHRGEVCLQKCEQNLNATRLELAQTRKENEMLRKVCENVDNLRKELVRCENELMMERDKLKSQDSLLPKQVNVHRWRKLKGCDPDAYELLVKVNTLQKRLISKSEELVFMRLKFLEKDRLFIELKQFFSRRLIAQDQADLILNYKSSLGVANRKLKVNSQSGGV